MTTHVYISADVNNDIQRGTPSDEIIAILLEFERQSNALLQEKLREEEPLMALHRRIRDLNRTTVDGIAAQLPPERAEALRRAYLVKAYPDIYGPTRLDRWLDEVLALVLTAPQRDGIFDAIKGYYRPYRDQHDKALQSLRDREEDAWKDARLNRLDPNISIARGEVTRRRNALMRDVGHAVWAMLTEQQQTEVEFPDLDDR